MANTSQNSFTLTGTLGGIVTTLFGAVDFTDLFKTVVLSITGTVVSVLVSILIKKLLQRHRRPGQ